MNRHQARGASAKARAATNAAPRHAVIVKFLLAQMMEHGQEINAEVTASVEGPVRSGHVVDVLMTRAAYFEESVLAGRFGDALRHAITVLFLARDLAIREGKIRVAKVATA